MKRLFVLILVNAMVFSIAACTKTEAPANTPEDTISAGTEPHASVQLSEAAQPPESIQPSDEAMPELTFIGHNSFKIKTADGIVIYVDPHWEGDYNEPADIILVSHEHPDHNEISLCTQNEGCIVLRDKDNINPDGTYNNFETGDIKVEPVAAYNGNHPKKSTCGFVITVDGVVLYIASDTSKIDEMADLKARNIDYAFFPIDGQYNMGPAEAMECAQIVGARHNTPVHMFSADPAKFTPQNLLLLSSGETIELDKG